MNRYPTLQKIMSGKEEDISRERQIIKMVKRSKIPYQWNPNNTEYGYAVLDNGAAVRSVVGRNGESFTYTTRNPKCEYMTNFKTVEELQKLYADDNAKR